MLVPHLCFKVPPCFSYRESPMLSLSYTSGNFSVEEFHAYPLSFMLSFHTLIAHSASVAWQSLLLTLISIDGHFHSPLVCLVDVRLSSLLLSTTTTFYSTYIAISMACAHVLRESENVVAR